MRRNSTSAVGALHPILFFVIVYSISLFLAFFVCSTVYYSINDGPTSADNEVLAQQQLNLATTDAVTAYK